MDEIKRRHYLAVMGIPLWLSKTISAQSIDAKPPVDVRPPVQPKPSISIQKEQNVTANTIIPKDNTSNHTTAQAMPPIANMDWETLATQVTQCQACHELVTNRSQTVFGTGNRNADLLIIGEAPGAEEDKQGEPFVGRAGQLLTSMLQAINLQREQVYIANILKCRPPNNRDPSANEAQQCEPWLLRQIELINPKLILAVGRIAAHNLLKTNIAVGKLRCKVHQYGLQNIPVIVTYHPSYLLRSPGQKPHAWKDLQMVLKLLNQDVVTLEDWK
ncbi:hypothetical protein TI05_11430 [Achromatium sp. WMS3]|nr:hypothetical protein TI05_11430 [Achromatium sp. WMS3]